MCENCTSLKTYRFETELDFLEFEKELDKKCVEKKFNRNSNNSENIDFKTLFKCSVCNQNWVLSFPERAWRGYFLTEEEALKYLNDIESEKKNGNKGCLIFLFIIISIVIIITIKCS